MIKSTKRLKKALATFLIVLMSIESFAAVVGDNDGAAFITKAEFDSMKNDFQSQLDRYNSSLDNKIDGAIASYLAGVSVNKKTELKCPVTNFKDIHWVNGLYGRFNKRTWISTTAYNDTGITYNEYTFDNRRNMTHGRQFWTWGAVNNMNVALWVLTGGNAYQEEPSMPGTTGRIFHGYEAVAGAGWPEVLGLMLVQTDDGDWIVEDTINGLTTSNGFVRSEYSFADTVSGSITSDTKWGGSIPKEWFEIGAGVNGAAFELDGSTDGTTKTYTVIQPDNVNYFHYDQQWELTSPGNTQTYTGYGYTLNSHNFNLAPSGLRQIPHPSKWTCKSGVSVLKEKPSDVSITDLWIPSAQQFTSDDQNHRFMLLSNDTNLIVNYAKRLDNFQVGAGTNFDWSDSDVAPFKLSMSMYCLGRSYMNYKPYAGKSPLVENGSFVSEVTLNFPLMSRATLSELKTAMFAVNEKPLAFGQGIPLIQDATEAGTLQLSITYDLKTADLSHTGLLDQKCRLSCKKSTFTSTITTDYFLDDSGTELKNKNFVGNTIQLAIPVKKDESVWFRIGPQNLNPSGEYIQIRDMRLIFET